VPTERAQIIRGCQIRVSLSWGVKSCKMAGLLPIDWTGFILRSKQEADLAMFQHWFKFDSQLQKNPWFSQFKLVGPAIYSFYSQNRFDTEQPNYVFFAQNVSKIPPRDHRKPPSRTRFWIHPYRKRRNCHKTGWGFGTECVCFAQDKDINEKTTPRKQ